MTGMILKPYLRALSLSQQRFNSSIRFDVNLYGLFITC